MLMGVLKPEWDDAATRGLRAWECAWKALEKNLSLYEEQATERVSSGTKVAVMICWQPDEVKTVIRHALGAIGTD